ncbi:pseudoazurin [Phyllobacterium brassicacearum]|uniref:Pseudoazurin n=2 Tax=Phyllobacterium brassicacearum TaxID=314235 RepID=A0A2P7B6F0_9HYPH|nr:pseudoazurin [Phyllobacterium brassicacearum]PSH62019.1 pseudoazurin [Phyllobacterium brassicacearum]
MFTGAVIGLSMLGAPAFAADFEVKMLNKGTDGAMVFEPSFVKVAKGDTVTFVPTDKGHNVETFKDLIPTGSTPFKSKMGETFKQTFDVDGAYAVKCTPHAGMGMVGLIVVGDAPANLEAVKTATLPKKARERLDGDIAKLGS